MTKVHPTSHSYFSQRLKLHFLEWGDPTNPHVLLVHGMQDHCRNWDWLAQVLSSKYHILAPDLRGHGDSEWSKGSGYNNLDYVYDLGQLIVQEDLNEVNLIGHSLGGTVTSLYAGLYPERCNSLISLEGVGGFWWKEREKIPAGDRIREWVEMTRSQAGRIPRRYDNLEAAFARMQSSNPHLSEERARHLTVHGSNKNEDGTYSWKFDNYTHSGMLTQLSYDDLAQIWQDITCPTLLINATDGFEHRIGQDDSMNYFNNARLEIIENAGHWLHHDQFDQIELLISTFLAEQTS